MMHLVCDGRSPPGGQLEMSDRDIVREATDRVHKRRRFSRKHERRLFQYSNTPASALGTGFAPSAIPFRSWLPRRLARFGAASRRCTAAGRRRPPSRVPRQRLRRAAQIGRPRSGRPAGPARGGPASTGSRSERPSRVEFGGVVQGQPASSRSRPPRTPRRDLDGHQDPCRRRCWSRPSR